MIKKIKQNKKEFLKDGFTLITGLSPFSYLLSVAKFLHKWFISNEESK